MAARCAVGMTPWGAKRWENNRLLPTTPELYPIISFHFNRWNTDPLWLLLTLAPRGFIKAKIIKMNQSSSYSPQPPGPLCLVDVDEVGHHAALKQTALSLHPDLE